LAAGCTGTETTGATRCGWGCRACHRWCGRSGTVASFGGGIGPAGGRRRGASNGLLQLHELARCHGFAHAAWHARALRAAGTGACRWGRTTSASGGTAVPADGLAHQLQGVAAAAGRRAGSCWTPRTAGTLRDTGSGALRCTSSAAGGCAGAGTPWNRLSYQLRARCGARGWPCFDGCSWARWSWSPWTGWRTGARC
jgi:hypothetical protein